MATLNKVMLIGNLTRDPELRYTPSGAAVTSFSIAVNRIYKLPSGERKEEASFIRIVAWGRIAETCSEYLKKGHPVFVEGRLQSRSWEGQDGQKRNVVEVVASNVQFLRSGGGSKTSPAEPARAAAQKEPLEEISLDLPTEEPKESGSAAQASAGDVPF